MNIKKIMAGVLSVSIISGTVANFNNFTYALSDNVSINYQNTERNIISDIKCGMKVSDVNEVIEGDIHAIEHSILSYDNKYNKYTNYYLVESLPEFNIDAKAFMFTEFAYPVNSEQGNNDPLINYGYNIGEYYNTETQMREFIYSEEELNDIYDNICNQLSEWYGEGNDNTNEYYSDMNVAGSCWWNTSYGEVWVVWGMDLWGSDGMNKIIVSCSDYSVLLQDYNLGDINNDGKIDAGDASDILAEYARIASNEEPTLSNEVADINGDDIIDAGDASLVLAYYAYTSSAQNIQVSLRDYVDNYHNFGIEDPIITTATTSSTVSTTTTTTTTEINTTSTDSSVSTATTTATTTVITTTVTEIPKLNISDFISNLYVKACEVDVSDDELSSMIKEIEGQSKSIDELALNLMSYRFSDNNGADSDYISCLYEGILCRKPSQAEIDNYISKIKSGKSRFSVFLDVVKSSEFKNVCEKYNMNDYRISFNNISDTVKLNSDSRVYQYISEDFEVSDSIGTAYRGELLSVVGFKGNWLEVKFLNQKGYLNKDYVSSYRGSGIKVLPVVNIPQNSYIGGSPLPTGCEVTALSTLMNYLGFTDAGKNYLAGNFMPRGSIGSTDPNYAFIGTPDSSSSYGAYANAIVRTANNYFSAHNVNDYNINNITGADINELFNEIDNGNPVLVWITMNCTSSRTYGATWTLQRGTYYTEPGTGTYNFTWKRNEHCSVLVGYNKNKNTVILADVLSGNGLTEYTISEFESAYKWLGSQSITITN